VERSTWTDERLDDKMQGIDRTFELMRDELSGMRTELRDELRGMRTEMRDELSGMRTEMRELRQDLTSEMTGLRSDFNALQRQLIQVGFTLVGVLVAAMTALIIAVA